MFPMPSPTRGVDRTGLRFLPALLLLLGLLAPVAVRAQGCVAVRGSGMCALHPEGVTNIANLRWQAFLGYRWLHSDRHFRGDHEEVQRQTAGTEVVNDSHFFDLGLSYAATPRVAASLVIPFVRHDRSYLYEHSGNAGGRYHTQSSGIGDIRFTLSSWIWDPVKTPDGNLQLGIGLKAPSGDSDARDIFITPAGPVVGFVDQSIQPGDGGWGFTLEANGYRALHPRWFLFGQAFYLFNPTDVNGTPTVTGRPRGNPGALAPSPRPLATAAARHTRQSSKPRPPPPAPGRANRRQSRLAARTQHCR